MHTALPSLTTRLCHSARAALGAAATLVLICVTAALPAAAEPAASLESPQAIKLDRSSVERSLAAVAELHTLENETADEDLDDWTQGTMLSVQAQRIIAKHGFESAGDFAHTTQSIAMARAAIEMEENSEEIQQARAQLERMKSQVPPDTYAMLERQMAGVFAMFDDQPEGNVELVREFIEQIDAAME